MKKYCIVLLLSFCFLNSNAQIKFLNNKITNYFDCNGNETSKVISVDVDNDGDLDIITQSSNMIVGWYENIDGLGNFGYLKNISLQLLDYSSLTINIADIDNDSFIDVVVSCYKDNTSGSSDFGKIIWFKNLGTKRFTNEILIQDYSLYDTFVGKIATSDMDLDGDIDIVANINNKLICFKNISMGTQFVANDILTGYYARSLALKDFDGDGDSDILISNAVSIVNSSNTLSKILLIKNNNNMQSFANPITLNSKIINNLSSFDVSRYKLGIYPWDIDNDSDLDITFVINGDIFTLTNTGLGSFSNAINITNSTSGDGDTGGFSDIKFEDMDNDGDFDMVTSKAINNAYGQFKWFENNLTSNNFINSTILLDQNNDYPQSFSIADINSDNLKDLIVGNASYNNTLVYFKNFTTRKTISHQFYEQGNAQAIDINNDGFIDIVSTNGSGKLYWYKNKDGIGNLDYLKVLTLEDFNGQYIFVNIDADPYIDILTKNKWYKNDGQGNFTAFTSTSFTGNSNNFIAYEDIDNDGKKDILFDNPYYNGVNVHWFKNLDNQGNFGGSQILANIGGQDEFIRKILFKDINGDTNKDLLLFSLKELRIMKALNNAGNYETISQPIYTYENANSFNNLPFFLEDLDTDGDLDLILGYKNSSVYPAISIRKNNGLGDFNSIQNIIAGANHKTLFPSDIDNDGDIDIVVTSDYDNKTQFFENLDGFGNFNATPIILFYHKDNSGSRIPPIDIDSNGTKDFIYSNNSFENNGLSWYKNLGISNNKIKGNIKLDIDNNGCTNVDNHMQNIRIINNSNTSQQKSTLTNKTGYYQFYIPEAGTYSTAVASTLPNFFSATPTSHTNTFLANNSIQTADFCVLANQVINDLEVIIYKYSEARPGFKSKYILSYRNKGTSLKTGNVKLSYENSKLTFSSAAPTFTSQTTNELTFNYTNLYPTETRNIIVEFTVKPPPIVNIGTVLSFTASVNPIANDDTPANNTCQINQIVVGSFDPNDINVLEGKTIFLNEVEKYLHYLIRFQNTGTASAINVRINNTLDDDLDWTSIQIDGSSHSYTNEIINGKNVAFIFDNIFLPASSVNEVGSQGYIAYKIKPKSNSQLGTDFRNNAQIYFDYNLPIETNTVTTKIIGNLEVNEFENALINVYPNPTNGKLTIESKTDISSIIITTIYGQNVMKINNSNEINISECSKGIYFLTIRDKTGTIFMKKIIKN